MKKIIVATFAIMALFSGANASEFCLPSDPPPAKPQPPKDKPKYDPEEIAIIDISIPDLPRPVSIGPPVTFIIAEARIEDKLIVTFNYPVGEITVTIEDEFGDIFSYAECNTYFEENASVSLELPTELGAYRLVINGERYVSEGYFYVIE